KFRAHSNTRESSATSPCRVQKLNSTCRTLFRRLKEMGQHRGWPILKKENILNLKQVIRVAVCAAIIGLCVAGAELFPAHSLAEQETRKSTAVAYQHESCPVERMAGFSSLHQL